MSYSKVRKKVYFFYVFSFFQFQVEENIYYKVYSVLGHVYLRWDFFYYRKSLRGLAAILSSAT